MDLDCFFLFPEKKKKKKAGQSSDKKAHYTSVIDIKQLFNCNHVTLVKKKSSFSIYNEFQSKASQTVYPWAGKLLKIRTLLISVSPPQHEHK